MSDSTPDLPVPADAGRAWLRWPTKLDFISALKAGLKATQTGLKVARGDILGAIEDAIAAYEGVGDLDPARQKAGRLVARALAEGMAELIDDHRHFLGPIPEGPHPAVEADALAVELVLDTDFFDRPESLPTLKALTPKLAEWLREHGRRDDPRGLRKEPRRAETISESLGPYYAAALAREYRKHADDYAPIWEAIQSPVTGIEQRAQDWRRYRAWLMRQPHQPLFADSFSLMQVYQRLRAWRFERVEESEADADALEHDLLDGPRHSPWRRGEPKARRVVVDVMDAINGWLDAADKHDALRVISGGPGAGKSSLAKVIAAKRAAAGERVLLIELHHFEMGDDLETAVNRFGRKVGLRHDVFDHPDAGPLLLIFDGLDELSIRGSVGKDAVLRLVEKVSGLLKEHNRDAQRVRALLLGREVVVQALGSDFRRWQRLSLLPYLVSTEDRSLLSDPSKLLGVDQRDGWWEAYAACTGRVHDRPSEVLSRGRIGELTVEPLLNYLVAIALDNSQITLSSSEATRSDVYGVLLRQVYERTYASAAPEIETARLKPVETVAYDDYHAFLMAIATVAWHGDGRSATLSAIQSALGEERLDKMDLLRHGAKEAVSRLVAAFYFREHVGVDYLEPVFEFTRQSFAEYLVACRIFAFLDTLRTSEDLSQEQNGSLDQYLGRWADFFGRSGVSHHVFGFVQDMLRRLYDDDRLAVQAYQRAIGRLIGRVLLKDFPLCGFPGRSHVGDVLSLSRNAGTALLMVSSACSRVTEMLTPFEEPSRGAFGSWLRRLQCQRTDERVTEVNRHLVWLPLIETSLGSSALEGADLRNSSLSGVDLFGADLRRACLQEALLDGADLRGAHLAGATLDGADLRGAHLEGAHLSGAMLRRVDLSDAFLQDADLRRANLSDADLSGADVRGARIDGAQLGGADMQEAVFDDGTTFPQGFAPTARGMLRG